MHSLRIHDFKISNLFIFPFLRKGRKVARRPYTRTRIYDTRENRKKRMSEIEQENQKLRDENQGLRNEMASFKAQMEVMTTQLKELAALKDQPPPPPPLSESLVVSSAPFSMAMTMPEGFPWGAHISTSQNTRP